MKMSLIPLFFIYGDLYCRHQCMYNKMKISNVYKVFSVTPRPICYTRSVVVTPTKQQNTHNDPLFTFRSNVIMISSQDFILVPGTGYIYYDLNIKQLILENQHVCVSCYAVCPNHIYRYMCLNDHHDDLVLEY